MKRVTKAGALVVCFKIMQACKTTSDESHNYFNAFSDEEDEEEEMEEEEETGEDVVMVGEYPLNLEDGKDKEKEESTEVEQEARKKSTTNPHSWISMDFWRMR